MMNTQTFSFKRLIAEYIEVKTGNTYVIDGLPIKAKNIDCAGLPSLDMADIQIYGLSQGNY